jgi:integrase
MADGKVKVSRRDIIGARFNATVRGLNLYRAGLGFYALRHVFETVAGGSRDQVAVDAIMGHSRNDMASAYRERIDDDRLQAVVDHVHDWLFGDTKQE